MQRTWMKVGKDFNSTPELQDRISVAIGAMKWLALPCELPFMQGHGIKVAIRELHLPKVSHVADSNALAPYGFMGVRCHYKDGQAEVYLVDTGCEILPVCSDFKPK